jgi:hypothetical protein
MTSTPTSRPSKKAPTHVVISNSEGGFLILLHPYMKSCLFFTILLLPIRSCLSCRARKGSIYSSICY